MSRSQIPEDKKKTRKIKLKLARIEKYARAEEDTSGNKEIKQEKGNGSPKRIRGNNGPTKQETELRSKQAVTTVFRIPIHKVLDQIRNQPYFRAPARAPGEFMGRNVGRRCAYHNEEGHPTQGCRALKAHLEDLVRQGLLRDLVDEARTREE